MDFYIADNKRFDICKVPSIGRIDIENSESRRDLQVILPLEFCMKNEISEGCFLYSPGTEYGGRLDHMNIDTSTMEATFTGRTFRGMLEYKFFIPSGSYIVENMEANAFMAKYVNDEYDVIRASESESDDISAKLRFQSLYDGFRSVLSASDLRMNLEAKNDDSTNKFYVELSAKEKIDRSEETEFSQDSGYFFSIDSNAGRYTHVLALGSGQLQNRLVLFGEIKKNNSIKWISSLPKGENVRIFKFDYPNAEDEESLIKETTEAVADANPTDMQSITVRDDENLELGDIVGGRDYYTGKTIKEEITSKIIKFSGGKTTISYKIGG